MTTITISDADIAALGGAVPRSGRLQVWRLTAPAGQAELDSVFIEHVSVRGTSFEIDPVGAVAHRLDAGSVAGLLGQSWTVVVPSTGTLSLAALVNEHAVDPGSFPPGPTPPAAWSEVLGQVTEQKALAVAAAGDALDAAGVADAAKDIALAESAQAGSSAFNAGASAAAALGHKNDAASSAGIATTKAAEAAFSAGVAGAAAGEAVTPVATDLATLKTSLPGTYARLDGVIAAPVYNAQGLPTSVTENGITTLYTYNPNGTPATQKVGSGPVRTFTYNLDGSFGGLA